MNRTRTVLIAAAAALAASSVPALAQAPAAPPPPGYPGSYPGQYQGQWHGQWGGANGQTWNGQWSGTYSQAGGPPAWGPPPGMDPEAWKDLQARFERCRDYRPSSGPAGAANEKPADAGKHADCAAFWHGVRPMPGGYPMMMGGYPMMPYGYGYGYGYAPYGYVMVPVMIPGRQKPCVETTTTTTTYEPVTVRQRVIPPRHKYIREKVVPKKKYKYIKE